MLKSMFGQSNRFTILLMYIDNIEQILLCDHNYFPGSICPREQKENVDDPILTLNKINLKRPRCHSGMYHSIL